MVGLVPSGAERVHLLRFYAASFLAEATNMAAPFKVLLAARFLGAPRLAIVLALEQAIALVIQVPVGARADRFGRKKCVVAGHAIVVLGWLLVPAAGGFALGIRTALVAVGFALMGVGSALITGIQESWTVDNLLASGRAELVSRYFGRDRFWASAGAVIANVATLALVARVNVRWFWVVTAFGEALAALVLSFEPESPRLTNASPTSCEATDRPPMARCRTMSSELLTLAIVLTWLAATLGMATETFQLALLATSHLSDQGFALLDLTVNGLGTLAPLVAVALLERFEPPRLLLVAIVTAGLVPLTLMHGAPLPHLLLAYLAVRTLLRLLYTVADDFQHRLLDASRRATAAATIHFLAALAQVGSAVVVAGLLHFVSTPKVLAGMGLLALPAALILVPWSAASLPSSEEPPKGMVSADIFLTL